MTSFSRNSAERQSSNGFSNYLDSKYPINSRSNFTFHEFPSETNLLDDSLLKRLSGFCERVNKYSTNIHNRLVLCSKDIEQLEKSVEEKVNEDGTAYNALLNDTDETVNMLVDQCEELGEEKSKAADEECRWMVKQLTEIKDGFKDIQKQRKEEIKAKLKELQEDIEELKVKLEKQKLQRDQISQSQIQEFGQAILKIQEKLSLQREQRIHGSQLLVKQIQEIERELDRSLGEQKVTRERKEALFTTLLQETYIKLQRI